MNGIENTDFETWKSVKGYESLYEISTYGNIKSLTRIVLMKGLFPFIKPEAILKPSIKNNGYFSVGLTRENKVKTFNVHQLMAIAYLDHEICGMELIVDHIDNDKSNNHKNNLQLIKQRLNASKDRAGYTSNFIGVCWDKSRNKWVAQISINGKTKLIGRFNIEYEAAQAYVEKLNSVL